MNKKEVNELKKVCSDECGFMNFNKVVTAYVDAEKNIKYYNNQLYNTISQDLSELILANVKNVFKGNIGKGLREYAFPNSSSTQSLFYNTLKSKLYEKLYVIGVISADTPIISKILKILLL